MSSPVRSFKQDLSESQAPSADDAVRQAIKYRFPDCLGIHQAHETNDRLGADYFLQYPGGRFESVDVKIRKVDWSAKGKPNLCLEILSNVEQNKIGWTLDPNKITDWVFFYFLDTQKNYRFNFKQLRQAFSENMDDLITKGEMSEQKTGTGGKNYTSKSVFVTYRDLALAICRTEARQEV
jgi:hypothetical protein